MVLLDILFDVFLATVYFMEVNQKIVGLFVHQMKTPVPDVEIESAELHPLMIGLGLSLK